jgi:thioredoxin-dependent peroxiredoxin
MGNILLKAGDHAPTFVARDYLGNVISFDDYKGQRILLSFFRGAACPFCNLRVRDIVRSHDALRRKGITVIAFFGSAAEEIEKYAGKQKTPFPIIADPKLLVYKQYRVEHSHLGMLRVMLKPVQMTRMMFSGFFNMNSVRDKPLIPADFIVNEHQVISRAYYGKDFGDHIPLGDILS